ncbi:hypothetical protein HAX54_038152, partial [Datura stramonium]|nr:hypothetical protein [Datura stramonium]
SYIVDLAWIGGVLTSLNWRKTPSVDAKTVYKPWLTVIVIYYKVLQQAAHTYALLLAALF